MKNIITPIITKRFPELLKEDGSINHNALARLADIPQPTITRILNDQIRDPSSYTINQLATALKVSPGELRGYTTPSTLRHNTIRESTEPYATRILFGLDVDQSASFAKILGKLSGTHPDKIHVKSDAAYSALSFFIRAADKANEPEIKPGDILVIDPKAPLKPGDFVLAKTKEDGVVLRCFAKKTPKTYALQAINKQFPTYEIANDPSHKNIIGAMVELRRLVN